jgi:hypothetical protein
MEKTDPQTKIGNLCQSIILKYELLILVLIILVLGLRIFHIPDTGIVTTLCLMTASVIYFFSAFAVIEEHEFTAIDNFIQKFLGIASSVSIIGIHFLIQHWPNGRMMITVGLISLIMCFVLIVYQKRKNPEIDKFNQLVRLRIIIISLLSVGLLYFGLK